MGLLNRNSGADAAAAIRAVQRRCNFAVFLGRLGIWLAGGCALAAVAVLAVRTIWPAWSAWLIGLVALAPLVVLGAWRDAMRRFVPRRAAACWLDLRVHAGGLLLAVDATGDPVWSGEVGRRLQRCEKPLPGYRLGRWGAKLGLWVLFLIAALLVPPREVASEPPGTFTTIKGESIARLAARVEDAKELGLLTQDEQTDLEETVKKLGGDDAGAFDQKNWQALDAANRMLDNKLAEANHALDVAKKQVEQACKSGEGSGDALSSRDAQRELAAALEKLAGSSLANNAPPELKRQLAELSKRAEAGQPPLPSDPQELQDLLDNAQEFLDNMDSAMQQQGCRDGQNPGGQGRPRPQPGAGMDGFRLGGGSPDVEIDLNDQPGEGEGEGEGEGPGLGEGGGQQGPDGDGQPGRGGINRGRGDAPMIWGDESDADGAKFKVNALPRGAILDPDTGELVGISTGRPKDQTTGSTASGASRNYDPTTGGPANRRDYSPAYRGPIRRYFDQQK